MIGIDIELERLAQYDAGPLGTIARDLVQLRQVLQAILTDLDATSAGLAALQERFQ